MYNGLPTGDIILADKGFTCEEYAGMALAKVKFPPFTRGKKQKVDVDWSRELSLVRIHMERVIGVLKQKFTILQGVLPITLVTDNTEKTKIRLLQFVVHWSISAHLLFPDNQCINT